MWEDHHALGVFPKSASMSCCQPVHEFPDLEDILEVGTKVGTWWSYHVLGRLSRLRVAFFLKFLNLKCILKVRIIAQGRSRITMYLFFLSEVCPRGQETREQAGSMTYLRFWGKRQVRGDPPTCSILRKK
jgi:hypothetical protein